MAKVNRNFGRLDESGKLEYAPLPFVVDGENVWTNMPETYIAEGYYPVVTTEKPVKDGFYYIPYYEQDGKTIVQRWEEREIVKEDVATEEDIQNAIWEGVNSIDI